MYMYPPLSIIDYFIKNYENLKKFHVIYTNGHNW